MQLKNIKIIVMHNDNFFIKVLVILFKNSVYDFKHLVTISCFSSFYINTHIGHIEF